MRSQTRFALLFLWPAPAAGQPDRLKSPARLHSLLLAGLLSMAGAASSHAAHYRVYLLGGQSNANGRGNAARLTEPLASPQRDIRFYWNRRQAASNVGHLTENTWIDLAPGSGHGTKAPVFPMEFGPELSFGRAMADAKPSERIAIIKFSVGGSNLYGGWAEKGPLYATFVATVKAGLSALTRAGDSYELGGMIWQQGENDANPKGADTYEANLSRLVRRIRKDLFGGRAAPFVIGSLSDSQYGSAIRTPGTLVYKVRRAQETVASRMRAVGLVNTDGFPVRPSDTIHLDDNGQVALGRAFAAAMLDLEDGGEEGPPVPAPATLLDVTFDGISNDTGAFVELTNGIGAGGSSDAATGMVTLGDEETSSYGFRSKTAINLSTAAPTARGFTAIFHVAEVNVTSVAGLLHNGLSFAIGDHSSLWILGNNQGFGYVAGSGSYGDNVMRQDGRNGGEVNQTLPPPVPSDTSLADGFTISLSMFNDNTWSVTSTGLSTDLDSSGSLAGSFTFADIAENLHIQTFMQGEAGNRTYRLERIRLVPVY